MQWPKVTQSYGQPVIEVVTSRFVWTREATAVARPDENIEAFDAPESISAVSEYSMRG